MQNCSGWFDWWTRKESGRKMPNEVVIYVTSRNDTAKGFSAARKDVEKFADDSADVYQKRFSKHMETLGRDLSTPLQNSGEEIGERLGTSSSQTITRKLNEALTTNLSKSINDSISKTVNDKTTVIQSGEEIGHALGASIGDTAGHDTEEHFTKRITETIKTKVREIGDN